jgi:hypothetical protein
MEGEVYVPILQLPRGVGLTGIAGDKIEALVQLVAQKPDPLTLEVIKIFPPDKIAVEMKETEKQRAYELHIVNKVDKAERYTGQVILKTNYPEKPELSISIGANIQGPIEVRPQILSFGKLNKQRLTQLTEKGVSMRRPVMVILNKGNDLRIEKCETKDSVFKVVSTRAMSAGRMFEIQVEAVIDKLKTGMNKDILKIHTNQKGNPVLEVPIQFEVL